MADSPLFNLFDRLGREVVDVLYIPSLEALFLGIVVWLVLRFDQDNAPRFRHILWLFVIIKPLLSVVLPWQGPLPLTFSWDTFLTSEFAGLSGFTAHYVALFETYIYAGAAATWILAVLAGIIWALVGAGLLYHRSRHTMPVLVPWAQALFSRCLSTVNITQPIRLRMSDDFASPTLITVGKPMVVIPSWCLIHLTPQELKQVFLHELTHYSRRDHFTLLFVQIAKICFFFHPFIWYASRRINVEAERACDVAVVTLSDRPQSYASSLLKVAEGALRARWHGVLEFARSASATALRIKDVLKGFDKKQYAINLRTLVILVLCGIGSISPLFYIPIPSITSFHLPIANLKPSVTPHRMMPVSLVLPAPVPSKPEAPVGLRTRPAPNAQEKLEARPQNLRFTGKPALTASATSAFFKSDRSPSTIEKSPSQPKLYPAMLGLSSSSPLNNQTAKQDGRWEQGQIEVQRVGNTQPYQNFSRMTSLRAGYLVTKTHEFGGVISLLGPGSQTEDAEEQGSEIDLKNRNSLVSKRTGRANLPAPLISNGASADLERDASNNRLRIGGFYRYNIPNFSSLIVPFIGMGAGIEVRSGQNPVIFENSGGIRCLFSKHAALVLQIDYLKDVDLSRRSHVNASLGFSTIF